jgi:hypothetical protein
LRTSDRAVVDDTSPENQMTNSIVSQKDGLFGPGE